VVNSAPAQLYNEARDAEELSKLGVRFVIHSPLCQSSLCTLKNAWREKERQLGIGANMRHCTVRMLLKTRLTTVHPTSGELVTASSHLSSS